MNESGRGLAYAALFTEIGFSLLVLTLIGAFAGRWVDGQLGTNPLFVMIGFFVGAGAGTVIIVRLVSRFLKSFE